MSRQHRSFRAGWVPTIAAALGILVTSSAGIWQMSRAAEKEERQAHLERLRHDDPLDLPGATAVDPEGLLYRRVRIPGAFMPERTVFLDNRVRQGVPGYEVVTPLRIGDGPMYVAVNRGWIAGTGSRDSLPVVNTPPGRVTVEGTVMPAQRVYELSKSVRSGRVWPSFSMERMRQESGLELQPILVWQESDTGDGLVRIWDRPDLGRARHLAYAFQWFAFSIAIFVTYVVLGFRRGSRA
jgi:surfeit locus 1 family protein